MIAKRALITMGTLTIGVVTFQKTNKKKNNSKKKESFLFSHALCQPIRKKKIIICADGTWNKPDPDGTLRPTNIVRLARGLKPETENGEQQVVYYHWGLGSRCNWVKEGIYGQGINQNIVDCYHFLVLNYEPGDEINLFGFSRGSFTMLSLSRMLDTVGIVPKSHLHEGVLWEAFEAYRSQDADQIEKFRVKNACEEHVPVKFMGLFETVKSLGFKTPLLRWLSRIDARTAFHGHFIPDNVEYMVHAVGIDEKRNIFTPTIQKPEGHATKKQHVKEVWFPGVHADIGGGFQNNELANYVCRWMMTQAEQHSGLEFDAQYIEKYVFGSTEGCVKEGPRVNENSGFTNIGFKKWRNIPSDAHVNALVYDKLKYDDANERYSQICNPNLRHVHQVKKMGLHDEINVPSEVMEFVRGYWPFEKIFFVFEYVL